MAVIDMSHCISLAMFSKPKPDLETVVFFTLLSYLLQMATCALEQDGEALNKVTLSNITRVLVQEGIIIQSGYCYRMV